MADYRFSGFTFDTDSLELRGESGQVPLEPQVFQLLQFLIENRERVVSKDEIIDAVWNGRIVSDTALNTRIAAIRRAVGDDGKTQAVIRTFPRRGFRFVAPLSEGGNLAEDDQPLPLPDRPSIAVLPFTNMSGDPEQEYFADGIAEDIITALSKFNWFFVIARNSSFTYKGQAVDVKKIAEELGVQYVLEGSVRKAGNRVRITAQLIDALSGRHLWAERYDRELTDVFAVQDEIAEAITGAVAPSFVSAEARRIERRHPENLDAWERAIKGNDHLWRLGRENLSLARRLFAEVIEMDPRNTFARAGLALACSWQVFWDWVDDPAETREKADEALKAAVRIDNDDAWVHAALCICRLHTRDIAGAIDSGQRALELNPNLALAEGALALSHAWDGNYNEAMSHADKATRLSPRDDAKAWWSLARVVAAFVTKRTEEQIMWAKRMVEAVSDHPTGWRFLAAGYAELDRIDEARGAIERYLELLPHHTVGTFRQVASAAPSKELTDRLIQLLSKAGLPK
jgi:TolB-like protein